ncbi:TRAP transporter small permease [Effusibacillus dendaii]|uniref:ABC transporter permease n=1 Tax=Effusibacillus dendaii TaxID=2743772 RepID=A0A7I8DIC2_9BACL|nr:TRAP transporter small permease [Effusibacillus dendaii]BCJ87591.1 ABC transporter permease [Effusibacillus dendaii]
MQKISKSIDSLLNLLIAFSLAIMCILVFGNVVLRYVFNSGITWSEEMARFLFIWMIFLGGIAAFRDHEHLGVDSLIKKLPRSMKKAAYLVSNLIILYTLWLVLEGSWKMTLLNFDSKAPATGLPMAFIYGIGIVVGVSMGLIVVINLFRLFTNRTTDGELVMTRDSEDELHVTTGN